LLKWKAETGVTDSSFEKLQVLMKKMLPRKNELPASTYEAKKPPRKRVPAKVMWYVPIIPRLKCLFRNKDHAKLLR
jgi:hypothetical protein